MNNFKEQQLTILRKLGNVLHFSYNLQIVNKFAKTKPQVLVKTAEEFYSWQIKEICDNAIQLNTKIICITGPSSSGKTTSATKIKNALKKRGYSSRVISLDNFFVNKVDTPLKEDGQYDLENVTAIDIPYFKKFIKDILAGNTVHLPKYDFALGERTSIYHFTPKKNEIIIIEGLHAFNPILYKNISLKKIYKVFVTVSSNFTVGDEVVISAKDLRLMRRLLRDYYNRGTKLEEDFDHWNEVCIGESKYISPLRNQCDYILNTTHLYEPLLYDKYLSPLIKNMSSKEKFAHLINIFNATGQIDMKYLPKNSLIREFLPNF